MKNKYLAIFLNVIAIIICLIIGYFAAVFSIFFFLGRHADKEMKNEFVITIAIYGILLFLIILLIWCVRNIWKILKK
jgi:H+/Cl- antiporter ClcA